jgi:MFS transporter, ACS family, hexuronate transporter
MKRNPNLHWWIAGLLATASALAYVDRQTLPLVVGVVQKTIPISDQQYGNLQFAFLLAYGIMYAGAGKITDVLGARWGYFVVIVWWSAANLMQGTVSSVLGLGVGLFLLGIGEGGCFPAGAKAISEWFTAKDRSLAFGIFNAGSGAGAALAPPFIAAIVLHLQWRWVFFITGTSGFVWAAFWLALYRTPSQHKGLTGQERSYLAEVVPASPAAAPRIAWLDLFRFRQTWALVIARFLGDAAWFFLIFWLPKYLLDVRHLNIKSLGYYAWIPYALAALGSLMGGWLSSYLIRKTVSLDRSRKICLGISAACLPLSLLISISPLSICIAFFSLAMFGHQSWSTILQTLTTDLFPSATVGSIAGLLGAAGAFGGMTFNPIVGALLTRYHSYTLVFQIAGLMHPLSFLIILLFVRRIEPVVAPIPSLENVSEVQLH